MFIFNSVDKERKQFLVIEQIIYQLLMAINQILSNDGQEVKIRTDL